MIAKKAVDKFKKRTNRELFLDKLRTLTKGDQNLIANGRVREALGWEESKYKSIKDQLREDQLIIVSRGYGGTVGLSSAPGTKALTLFISYSHADETLKNEFVKHLMPLKRQKLIDTWHDRILKAGDDVDHEISSNLEKSDIVLLLVSVDFVSSSYCYDIELDKAIDLHQSGKAVVIPIILRSCLWQHTSFAKLLALPRDGKAVTAWGDRDEAFVNIVEGIRARAQDLLSNR